MNRLTLGFCIFPLLLASVAWGQVGQGSITGTVTDSSGAVIPNVTVTTTNVDNGVSYASVRTNSLGDYTILHLPIGSYTLGFKAQGFAAYNRSGITISVGQIVKLDVTLKVGRTAQTVSVRANASPLATQNATQGTTLNSGAITDMPFSVAGGRDITKIALMTVPTVNGSYNGDVSVANSLILSKMVKVDGTDSDAGLQGFQSPPGMDAVSEFRVETSGISANDAGTGGGAFIYVLKSGTNQFHGSAFGFLENEAFNANTWDNNYWLGYCNQAGTSSNAECSANHNRARDRFNDWGFSAGGPVIIPKLYNGKNKTFVFGDFERYSQTDLRFLQNSTTVPTSDMLNGDFSALLDKSVSYGTDSAGNTIYRGAIFNPATGDVFPGNVIPQNLFSPLASNVVGLYQKYYPANNSNLANNFNSPYSGAPLYTQYNYDLKLDQNFSPRNHFSTSVDYFGQPIVSLGDNAGGLWMNNSSDPGPLNSAQEQHTINYSWRAVDTYTFSSNLVNIFSVARNYWWKGEIDPSPVNNQTLGFTANSGTAANNFPIMNFTGANGINETSIGNRFNFEFQYTRWYYNDNLNWMKGRNNIKMGGSFITFGADNSSQAGQVTYNFSNLTGVPSALATDSTVSPYIGFGFANFLLGDVSSASQTEDIALHGRSKGLDLFIEDTIKVTPRFTLDASLRWDFNTPWHETSGHWSEFNLDATNPTWAPYKGAYTYLSDGSQTFYTNNNYHQFGPHVGAAYQFTKRLVARAAWGMFYVPLGINTWGAIPYQGQASFGYTSTNDVVSPAVNASAFSWDKNVYPGVSTPQVRDPSLNQVQVWGPVNIDPNTLTLGKTQNWNAGIQYEITNNTVLDVSYMGNIGRDLHAGYLDPRNYPTWAQYKPLLLSGNATASISTPAQAAAAGVPWLPFAVTENFVGGWSYGYYPAYAAISPYPQVAAGQGPLLFADSPLGSSGYQGVVVELRKRASNGLMADLSYVLSRSTGNVNNAPWSGGNMTEQWLVGSGFQDPWAYNSFANLISPADTTSQVKGYVTYQLPFGRGKRWLHNSGYALNALAGGWELGTVVSYHTGYPMAAVHSSWGGYPGMSSSYANYSNSVPLSNTFNTLDLANPSDPSNLYFNPAAFADPTYGNLGNQQPYWSSWRGWGYADEDLSILKRISFGSNERYQLTLRGEFFDVFNRHYWNNPNAGQLNSPYFGAVTGVTGNRTGQVGLRFQW